MQAGIEKDIEFFIKLCPGASYATLCESLQAYEPKAVFACANNLMKQGKIRMGSQGFECCEAQGAQLSSNAPAQAHSEGTAERHAQTEGRATPNAPDHAEPAAPQPTERHSNTNDKNVAATVATAPKPSATPKSTPPTVKETAPIAHSRETWFQELSKASKGSLLATSSIKLLNLPDEMTRSFIKTGVTTIADVVSRVDTLGKAMPTDSAIAVCQALLKYSGEPLKLNIGEDTKRQLHSISGSASFTFDWLGVLGTTLPRNATDTLLADAVAKRGNDLPGKKDAAFELLAASYAPEIKSTVLRLENHLKSKGYPVFEDSFEAIMLPIIAVGFEYGDYENQNEALAAGGKLVDDSQQTKDACFGMLRDQILELREKGRDSSAISVRWAKAFIDAAERIAALDCGCAFDSDSKKLTIQ